MEWEEICKREEEYWRQKSRELWLREGDKNTNFFQMSAKQKRVANTIFSIKEASLGKTLRDAQEIQDEGVNYFKNLVAPASSDLPLDVQEKEIIDAIPHVVCPLIINNYWLLRKLKRFVK